MIHSRMTWGFCGAALVAALAMTGACTSDVEVGAQKGAGGSATSSASSSSSGTSSSTSSSGSASSSSSSSSSSSGTSSSGGVACATNADCGPGNGCGFAKADGCAAVGQCFPVGPMCNGFSPGCSCAGTTINIACTGLPAGYETAPFAYPGACATSCSLGPDPLPCNFDADCAPYGATCIMMGMVGGQCMCSQALQCAGLIAFPPCPAGLICVQNTPGPDVPGYCYQACGDPGLAQCPAGLNCVFTCDPANGPGCGHCAKP